MNAPAGASPAPDSRQTLLVLIYGMACPLRCDFCCHPVEEYGGARIGVSRAVRWIEQAAALEHFPLVVFSGGEPFLYLNDIREILAQTAPLGLGFRIVTAAHWAKDDDVTRATLAELKALGLTELSLSTDFSHQRFVPRTQVERAACIAHELGLHAEVASVFWQPGYKATDVVSVPKGVMTSEGLAVPIGRGKTRQVTPEAYGLDKNRFGPCAEEGVIDVTVYPNGDVYPCCSGGFNREAKLCQGNLDTDTLATVTERIYADRYLKIALSHGLGAFLDVIAFIYPELKARLPQTDALVSSCQVCALLHGDPALRAALAPAIAYAAQIFSTVVELSSTGPQEAQASGDVA